MPTAPLPNADGAAMWWGELVANARSLWSGVPRDLQVPASRLRAFQRATVQEFLPDVRLFVRVIAPFDLFFLLTDRWAFAAYPGAAESVGVARLVLTGVAGLVLLGLRLRPAALSVICTFGTWATCAILATTLARIGGPSGPWFHFLYPFALSPVAWYIPPDRRIFVSFGTGAAVLLAYFGTRPAHLDDPMAAASVGYLFFVVMLSLGIGVVLDRGRLRLYCAQSDLAYERSVLAERVAEQTASLRRFAMRLDEVQDAERAHVARELHDELGQTLTAARLSLRLTTQRFEQQPVAIGPNLTQLSGMLERLTEQTRTLVRDLRPPVLDDLGLPAAVEWLASQAERHGGPPCNVTVPEDRLDLPDLVALTTFRFVQEALTNVGRHARAQAVTVSVRREPDALVAEVCDDGVGMPAGRTNGIGLIGMRERAAVVGGAVSFHAGAAGGTRVRLRIPLWAPT